MNGRDRLPWRDRLILLAWAGLANLTSLVLRWRTPTPRPARPTARLAPCPSPTPEACDWPTCTSCTTGPVMPTADHVPCEGCTRPTAGFDVDGTLLCPACIAEITEADRG
ncbi:MULTISPECIES: hypothetical protein [unclassified Crossiella]|uniref:hypothetical protein n=1 Tax=unclassified Crossiella TaxID=2620835 RepID=UPI001FFE8300|nr:MULTISPECIES: hypothetical protein [unclassified Crossiella]MCK2242173.1 hypothetical protein [Crossiella sp. S99.2]MCK2256076.1 hypothetical protein [Crossiella sp. S99.1]